MSAAEKTNDLVADGFADVRQAADYLKVSRAKLYAMMDSGDLPYAKFDRCRRIPWAALRAYAAQRMVGV